jgi:hypothetical protein
MPDWEPLARERFAADKDKYAKVAERRLSSHILFMCSPQKCDYEDVNKLAAETLAALRNGADFKETVEKYSDDQGTKSKGGEFRWLSLGESGVVPQYTEAVFAIENVGQYSDVVSTKFGLHIIRLDGVEPPYYKSYEDVKGQIIAALESEYRKLAAMEFDRGYGPSGKFVVDETALDEMLAPYKTLEVEGKGVGDVPVEAASETPAGAE